jgi:HSP20 family molecular chaperone IbpA
MRRVIYLWRPHVGRDSQGLQQDLERGFQHHWGQPSALLLVARARAVWQPPADVYETGDALVVRVELPGMRDAEIEVQIDERTLRISGRRPDQRGEGVTAYHQMGINTGAFALEVFLPGPVDYERVNAAYDDGFLTVVLPRPNA